MILDLKLFSKGHKVGGQWLLHYLWCLDETTPIFEDGPSFWSQQHVCVFHVYTRMYITIYIDISISSHWKEIKPKYPACEHWHLAHLKPESAQSWSVDGAVVARSCWHTHFTNHVSVSAVNHDVSPCFYSIKLWIKTKLTRKKGLLEHRCDKI